MNDEDVLLSELKSTGLTRLAPEQINNLALRLLDSPPQMANPSLFIPGRLLVTILEDRLVGLEEDPEASGDFLYYVQDTRQYVGNSVLWWKKDGHGYGCDIREAHVFTSAEANKVCRTDHFKKWEKDSVDSLVSMHIDIQSLRSLPDEAPQETS